MSDNYPPILFVVCNDYGELALAIYLMENQPFAQNATLMLPPRLYANNPDILPGRTLQYQSADDIRQAMTKQGKPGILGLFSGYLLPIHRLCDSDELVSLLHAAQTEGWSTFTSDPFVGLLDQGEPSDLITLQSPSWSIVWAIFAPIEKRRLVRLLTALRKELQAIRHVYPLSGSRSEKGRNVGTRMRFHNPAYLVPPASAPPPPNTQPRWLFVLGDQDHTVQEGLYGNRKFRKLLTRRLHETLKEGRRPTLIAGSKVINWVRKSSPVPESMELLTHCDYYRFLSLLRESEYVFYWNATSFSCILRTLMGKPWFTFDDGHLLRGMNSEYRARVSEWFYQDCEPPRLAFDQPLTIEALQEATMLYLQSAWRIQQALLATSDPPSLISELDPARLTDSDSPK